MALEIIFLYLKWHFVEQPKEIFQAIKNFLKFGIHFFSIPFLFKTLFSHWRRYYSPYPRGFNPGKILETWVSNQISRVIGAIVRLFLIFFGLIFEILILLTGFLVLFLWWSLPLILFFALIYGTKFLF